jgi:hypothetical protein
MFLTKKKREKKESNKKVEAKNENGAKRLKVMSENYLCLLFYLFVCQKNSRAFLAVFEQRMSEANDVAAKRHSQAQQTQKRCRNEVTKPCGC